MLRFCKFLKPQVFSQIKPFTRISSPLLSFQSCYSFSISKNTKSKQHIENLSFMSQPFSSYLSSDKNIYFESLSLVKGLSREEQADYERVLETYTTCKDLSRLSLYEIENILGVLYLIAHTYKAENNDAQALKFLKESIELATKVNMTETYEMAHNNFAMGAIYLHQDRVEEAERHLKKSDKILMDLPETPDNILLDFQNKGMIARLYIKQGKTEEALNILNEILSRKQEIAEPHLSTLLVSVYQDLGQLYSDANNHEKAIESWKEGLYTSLRLYGEDSTYVEYFNGNIARILYESQELEEATQYAKNALNISIKVYSRDSPQASWNYCLLGQINLKKGDFISAIENLKKGLRILEKNPDESQMQRGDTLTILARAQFFMDNDVEAEELFDKGIKILTEILGENTLQIAEYYLEWAHVIRQNETKLSDAKVHYQKALEIYEQLEPINKLVISDIYGFLGEIIFFEGDLDGSLEAWKNCEKLFLETSDDLARHEVICSFMGGLYMRKADLDKSLEYFEKTIKVNQQQNKLNDESLGTHYWNLGRVYEQKEILDQAVDAYSKGLECDRKLFGKDHDFTKESAVRIKELLEKLDRKEEAENIQKTYSL